MRIESGTGIEGGIRIGTCSNRDRLRNSASNWHREQDLHRNRERDSDHDHDSDRNRTIYKVRASTDRVVNTLFVLLSTVSALSKQLTFNLRTARVDALVEFINGDSFRAENGDHVRFLKRNALVTRRLLKFYLGGVLASGVLWVIFPLINRKSEQAAELTAYFPFDVQQSPAFECASIWLTTVLIIQGYGNVTMDCMIAAFYAQARTQLRILRYNFERICDTNVDDLRTGVNTSVMCESYAYKDVGNEEYRSILQRKLIRCVEHYRDIVWFIDEVESLFGEAMTVQFLIMVWVICMTTYKIVDLNIASLEFMSMTLYLMCILGQLFLYCYYGTQLKVESERINESVFRGRWWLLSPRWRRQLLVVMARYLRCIRPRAAYVISLSLDTYISVLRASYTLFTILKRK